MLASFLSNILRNDFRSIIFLESAAVILTGFYNVKIPETGALAKKFHFKEVSKPSLKLRSKYR